MVIRFFAEFTAALQKSLHKSRRIVGMDMVNDINPAFPIIRKRSLFPYRVLKVMQEFISSTVQFGVPWPLAPAAGELDPGP